MPSPRRNTSPKRKATLRKSPNKTREPAFSVSVSPPEPLPTLGELIGRKEPEPVNDVPAPFTPQSVTAASRKERRSVKWPRDWKQAFKERFFPAWALAQWPVEYEERTWCEDVPESMATTGVGPVLHSDVSTWTLSFTATPEAAKAESKRILADDCRTPAQIGWDDCKSGDGWNPTCHGFLLWSDDCYRYNEGYADRICGEPRPE